MYILLLFLPLIHFTNEITSSRDIEIMNSGVVKLRSEDMILAFFVTIHNHGQKPRNVIATMVECCEEITEDDTDCDVIQIHGERLDALLPGTTQNVTFLYPNIYGYNRKGTCTVDIWNRGETDNDNNDDTSSIRHRIDFDTTVKFGSEVIPPYLQDLHKSVKLTRCDTTDLDPFDGCNPVDCRLKYSGLRNYFNRKRRRCQKVPVCLGDPNKELPDVAYVPVSNTCRDLEKVVTRDDILGLISHKFDGGGAEKPDLNSKMVNIQCHHGEIDVRTGLCICDYGWTSEMFEPEKFVQSSSVYSMCDKKCHPDQNPRFNYLAFGIGGVLALWIFFLVVLSESCNYLVECYKKDVIEEEEVCYYQVGSR